ncbi:MAG: hypothetical protein IJ838_03075 [Paludibacteraceae bacterium]|nr:hypothetical protein [Paludibacteraceae bacterium]
MKKISFFVLSLLLFSNVALWAQQLPDPHFEDWSSSFNGDAQPKYWHGSNVSQVGVKFTFLFKRDGRTGSCAYVGNREVGAMGITETAPGYFGLSSAWNYLDGIKTSTGCGGMEGGYAFTNRPDTMSVWIRRTGSDWSKEDFNLIYYAWKGRSRGDKYKSKGGSCESTQHYNEECDIRSSTNPNPCGTAVYATQIAEGWYRARAQYNEWTNIRIPIYYMTDDKPEMINVIFSGSNYPNARNSSGLYAGNGLYVDDVELIYSSKIQKLYIDGVVWNGFNPNTEEEQVYSLGESATKIPEIYAMRGSGTLTNSFSETTTFSGRRLGSDELTIKKGGVDEVTTLTVKAEDGSSTMTYRIRFVKQASSNAYLAGIMVNGKEKAGFNPYSSEVEVELPYGTTAVPTIEPIGQEEAQTFEVMPAESLSGVTTIRVTAANGTSQRTYTVRFKVALLSDNSLKDILVNGSSVAGFMPEQTTYRVSLPLSTTAIPTVKAVSAYPDGEQTIQYKAPDQLDGGMYQILVSTPGNTSPRIYKLNFRLEASTYSRLKNITLDGVSVERFDPEQFTYYVTLPMGSTSIPQVGFEKGDDYQTVTVTPSGVNGTTLITVVAASGAQSVYKIIFTTPLSDVSLLEGIYLNGVLVEGFEPNTRIYQIAMPVGSTEADFPVITWQTMDEYEKVDITYGGINGTTRLTVTAGDGTTTQYQLQFSVAQDNVDYLTMIYLDGEPLPDFDKDVTAYTHQLAASATTRPEVTYDKGSAYQTVTERKPTGLTGDYVLTVRPQSGATRKYTITFTQQQSGNSQLQMIQVGGVDLAGFDPATFAYTDTLPAGQSTIPEVVAVQQEATQKVVSVREGNVYTITITAQSGATSVYTIRFVIQKSESAFLNMIYLDGDSLDGFDKNTLSYTYQLLSATCPRITVEPADEGQQVAITSPYGVGQAQIYVQPEQGAPNIYTIDFVAGEAASLQLAGIEIDGTPLSTFSPEVYAYTIPCGSTLPTVSAITAAGQDAQVLTQGNVVTIYVQSGAETSRYVLTFEHAVSADCSLSAILIDGTPLATYLPDTYAYTVPLPAGSELPAVTYIAANELQTIYMGQVQEAATQIVVVAEDGITQQTYTVTFQVVPYSDARLQDMTLEGVSFTYDEDTYDYYIDYAAGQTLPELHIVPKTGQTTMVNTVSDSIQQVLVLAQSGDRAVYTVHYRRIRSSEARLQAIRINNDELAGFDPDITHYVDSLAWRTKDMPSIQPVGMLTNQTITTYRSKAGGTTRIHVVAPDGFTTKDYYVSFPLPQSDNTALQDLYILTDLSGVELTPAFSAEETDYTVSLPYGTTAAPAIRYEKAEAEQTVSQTIRTVGDTSIITVTAENGDTRTYRIAFIVDTPHKDNRLTAIRIAETGESLDVTTDEEQRDFTVHLPYGTRTMTVAYDKMYETQTVVVKAGGVNAPTQIVVKANVDTVPDEVYTLTPVVPTADPAVLTDLEVNDVTISGFESERFSYIVNVSGTPVVRYTLAEGASITVLEQSIKHWQAEVTYGGRTNVYDLWYYYPADVIPNADFTEWTKADTYTKADKPVGWSCVADAVSNQAAFTPDDLASKSGSSVVNLKTIYSWAGGGDTPGYITLGRVSGSWGIAGNSSFTISGGISFHNSPDTMKINYHLKQVKEKNQILYTLTGINGTKVAEWNNSTTTGGFETYTYDLTEANSVAGYPTFLNITLNSFYQINRANATIGGTRAEMLVDWISMVYNKNLTSITVNGIAASRSGDEFTVTLTDPEAVEVPQLAFTGEVNDQARQITWSAEVVDEDYAVRTAAIRNFAENGSDYNDYTLYVRRPLCSQNTMDSLYINGARYNSFVPTTTDYTIHLTSADRLPDLQVFPASSRQTLTTTYSATEATITVTPEYGESTVYTIHFVVDKNDDTSLTALTGVTAFDPAQTSYTFEGDSLPDFFFGKAHDMQIVEVANGVITVTAEDGSQGTYTITLVPRAYTTSAQLSELELDGTPWQDFDANTYTYTHEAPQTIRYTHIDWQDSIVYTQNEAGMTWTLYGLPAGTSHTYQLLYPTDYSDNTQLAGIYVNDQLLEGFDNAISDYTLESDTALMLQVVKAEEGQKLEIVETDSIYTIRVTAEDGNLATYTLRLTPHLSDNSYLEMIYLDGVEVEGFRSDSTYYVVTLPAPIVKEVEPAMPAITYLLSQQQAQVEVQTGRLGESSYLIVTAENGSTTTYELLIQAEPSHNADLTGIIINGVPVDRFEKGRHYYSTWAPSSDIAIDWTADDQFLTVTTDSTHYASTVEYNLHVVAQDGVTSQDYKVEIFVEFVPNDARLANILLDGIELNDFERTINHKLVFDPDNNTYLVNLPATTTTLPQVSAQLMMDGQKVDIAVVNNKVNLTVTAKDGITQVVYTVEFAIPLSSVATLEKIYLDGELMTGFAPNEYYYFVELPVGEVNLPEVVVQKHETAQTVAITQADASSMRASVLVTAEDGVSQATYNIVFAFQVSSNCDLQMLYLDGDTLTYMQNGDTLSFDKALHNYSIVLPVGTTFYPDLTWEADDQWQTIDTVTISQTASTKIQQVYVTAATGRQSVYTVNMEIRQSDNTRLSQLFIDDRLIADFDPDQTDYFYTVAAGTTRLPKVDYEAGDAYQVIRMDTLVDRLPGQKSLEKKIDVVVTAQNHANRTYTVHFPMMLSGESLLSMIWKNGQPLETFNKDVFDYTIEVPYNAEGERTMPAITVSKMEEEQNVDIVAEGDSIILIKVLAEDGVHTDTYRVIFNYGRSPIAILADIKVGGQSVESFHPDTMSYTIYLFEQDTLPEVEWVKADPMQSISVMKFDTTDVNGNRNVTMSCTVTAPDEENAADYSVYFKFSLTVQDTMALSAALDSLYVRGLPVNKENGFDKDFMSDTLDYAMTPYPMDAPATIFFDTTDISFVTRDPLARHEYEVESRLTEDSMEIERVIRLYISDHKGQTTNQYTLTQRMDLSHDSTVTAILLDGEPMWNFDPEVHSYQVSIKGKVPGVTYVMQDSTAYAPEVTPGALTTDTTTVVKPYVITCMSQYAFIYDKNNEQLRNTYTIEFIESDLDQSAQAQANDVLVKVLAGSNQVAFASLRNDVQIVLSDMHGHILATHSLQAIDPRYAIVSKDANGRDYFNDVTDLSKCTIVTLDRQTLYMYTVFYNSKKVVKSGKLLFAR